MTHIETKIDFQPIYKGYRYDRDKMRSWFSSDPDDLFEQYLLVTVDVYRVTIKGITYDFSDVPLEFGDYFARRGEDASALTCYFQAYNTNGKSREALQRLIEAHQRLGDIDEAKRFERLLKAISDESKT